ncbi:MAG: acyl carrier protein [Gemmatimonadaceae bacterium]
MDTLDDIKALAAKQFGGDPESVNADLPVDQLGIDSLGFLEFLFELEDHFGFPIPQEAVANVHTLQELANVVDGLRTSVTPPSIA